MPLGPARSRLPGVALILLLTAASSPGHAGSFAESLQSFILGPPAGEPARMAAGEGSARCMRCHDGSRARAVPLKHADQPLRFNGHGNVDHPVGMRYAAYARRNPVTYVRPAALDPRITLVDGRVVCISCHSLKPRAPGSGDEDDGSVCSASRVLTTGTDQTRLCLSCHAL